MAALRSQKPAAIACQAASLSARANAAADDLQATIDIIAKRPDADASRVIVIGSEIAGAVAVALVDRTRHFSEEPQSPDLAAV